MDAAKGFGEGFYNRPPHDAAVIFYNRPPPRRLDADCFG